MENSHISFTKVAITCKNKNKIQKFDPLEAMKTFKGRKYELYCEISGTEPSSVTLSKNRRRY